MYIYPWGPHGLLHKKVSPHGPYAKWVPTHFPGKFCFKRPAVTQAKFPTQHGLVHITRYYTTLDTI